MNYYAALDVSLRSVHLCVIDGDGEIQAEGQVDSEAQAIDGFLRKLGLEITSVGLEAGTLTQYLTYGLRDAGYHVVCMEARQVSVALSAMRNKTDKNDARGIQGVWYQVAAQAWTWFLRSRRARDHRDRSSSVPCTATLARRSPGPVSHLSRIG